MGSLLSPVLSSSSSLGTPSLQLQSLADRIQTMTVPTSRNKVNEVGLRHAKVKLDAR